MKGLAVPLTAIHSVIRITKCATASSSQIRHDGLYTIRCQNGKKWNPNPDVDTRIHWSSPDEGWIGVSDESASSSFGSKGSSVLDGIINDLASQATDTHYQFLGVPADADIESIKTAYRKLSKMYHPDTTSLPVEIAAKKFLRLQKAYDVLSSSEERRLYDWNLAKEVTRQPDGQFVWPQNYPGPRRGPQTRYATTKTQKNEEYIDFTGQQIAALVFEAFALLVSFLIVIYVAFFKH